MHYGSFAFLTGIVDVPKVEPFVAAQSTLLAGVNATQKEKQAARREKIKTIIFLNDEAQTRDARS
jgi:hypothetical protein